MLDRSGTLPHGESSTVREGESNPDVVIHDLRTAGTDYTEQEASVLPAALVGLLLRHAVCPPLCVWRTLGYYDELSG